MTPSPPRSRAFTLTELLVAIAIISTLLLFLLPMFRSTRMQAGAAACFSNLRVIGNAIFTYQGDHNGRMISYAELVNPADPSGGFKQWPLLLAPYLPPKEPTYHYSPLLRCPGDRRPRATANPIYTDYGLAGLNGVLFGVHHPVTGTNRFNSWLAGRSPKMTSLPDRSQVMLVSDIDQLLVWGPGDLNNQQLQSWRHDGAIHAVFGDGHVKRLRRQDVPSNAQTPFWNGGNPLPIPPP